MKHWLVPRLGFWVLSIPAWPQSYEGSERVSDPHKHHTYLDSVSKTRSVGNKSYKCKDQKLKSATRFSFSAQLENSLRGAVPLTEEHMRNQAELIWDSFPGREFLTTIMNSEVASATGLFTGGCVWMEAVG